MKIISLLLISVLLAAIGQLLVKFGINIQTAQFKGQDFGIGYYLSFLINPKFMIGMLSYIFASLLWIYILTMVELNFTMPFMSLTYILIMLGAYFFLNEPLSSWKIAGTLLISIGLVMISIKA